MGYEFFDDVAFYYVMQSLLAVFLVPPTIYYLFSYLWSLFFAKKVIHDKRKGVQGKCKCPDCVLKDKHKKKAKWTDHITWRRVLFVSLWLVWIYLWVQLPNYQTQELVTFKPFDILGLQEGADEGAIKKAYRSLSRKYHPDKDPSPEAATKFRQLTLARDALLDPKAKANYEKFGNPDGYQGVSVTIGLPSWLLKKENNVPTLMIYFLLFFVILPIGVYYWYKHSSQFAESGVMNNTMYWFGSKLTEQMSLKVLVELMASAQENYALVQKPMDMKDFKNLQREVAESIGTPKFKDRVPYITKANVLWHAYLNGTDIPTSLKEDVNYLLKDAHKLLDALLQVALAQKFYKPTVDIISLSQCVTQGLMYDSNGLLQLPHFTGDHVSIANKKKVDLQDFREMQLSERQELFKDFTPAQWVDINTVLQIIPNVALKYRYEVEDEEGIYEGDVILLTIELMRDVKPPAEGEEEEEVEKKETKKPKSFEERLDDLPVTPKSKLKARLRDTVDRTVHSLRFPYPKHERWVVYLVEHLQKQCDKCRTGNAVIFCQNCNGAFCGVCDKTLHRADKKRDEEDEHRRMNIPASRIVGFQKVPNLMEYEEIQMRFRPPVRAKYSYQIFARCDSYLDCDVEASFKLDVLRPKPEEKEEEQEGLEDDPEDEEEKPLEAKWYFMYCTSFWEMIGNIIVFIILGFVLMNFLQQRGYWQKYVEPILNRGHALWLPIWRKVHPVISPVYDPAYKYGSAVFTYLSDRLHRPVNVTRKFTPTQDDWDL